MAKRTEYREYFEKALELDLYRKNHPYHIGEINEIEELMIDVCCSTAKTIRISGDDKPKEVVKSRSAEVQAYVQMPCTAHGTVSAVSLRWRFASPSIPERPQSQKQRFVAVKSRSL